MADIVVILGILTFFGFCALYVAGLDRLVGPDDVGAGSDALARGDVADEGGSPMSAENLVGLVLSLMIAVYLVAALLVPEKF